MSERQVGLEAGAMQLQAPEKQQAPRAGSRLPRAGARQARPPATESEGCSPGIIIKVSQLECKEMRCALT
jgi:hypothetical protein